MKDYRVRITKEALRDMEDINNYMASALQAPENAMRQYNRLADAVESLKEMPDRFRLFDVEPWHSRGMHRMNVDNYSVFYFMMLGSKGLLPPTYDTQHAHFVCNVLLKHSQLSSFLSKMTSLLMFAGPKVTNRRASTSIVTF